MNTPPTIRVAVVEDDPETCETLRQLISKTDGLSCIGAFERCEAAMAFFQVDQPDVVLMDINLPGITGIEGTRSIKRLYPAVKVVMLTVYRDDERIFQSICAGASGYLLKRTPREELVHAIREVYEGGAPMNAGIARRVLELLRENATLPPLHESTLTQRETELLQALVDGCSYKMAADRLFISVETVRNHIKHIYEKLHVHSKSEAVAKALKERLV